MTKQEKDLLKDALRYRWLRDTNHYREVESSTDDCLLNVGVIDRICIVERDDMITQVDQDTFDEVIDQAMIDWIKNDTKR
jgi:hypothetical protein